MGWFDDDEEDKDGIVGGAPKTPDGPPVSAAQDPVVRAHLMKRLERAQSDSEVTKARKDSDSASLWTGVASGLGQMLTAKGKSRGGAGFDDSVMKSVAANARGRIGDAQQARKDRIDGVLTEDKMQQQGIDRDRATTEFGWKGNEQEEKQKDRAHNAAKRPLEIDALNVDIAGKKATTANAYARTAGQNISNSTDSLKLGDAQAKRDPASRSSASARLLGQSRLSQMIKGATDKGDKDTADSLRLLLPDLENTATSAQAVDEMGLLMDKVDSQGILAIQAAKLTQGDRRLDLQAKDVVRKGEQFDERKIQKFQNDAASTLGELRKTEAWKSADKTISGIPNLRVLIADAKTDGGLSLGTLGPSVARVIAGETGVLTDLDVVRYVQNPALVPGIMDHIARLSSGTLGDMTAADMERLVDLTEKAMTDKQQKAIAREATLFSRREGVPYEDALHLFDETYKKGVQAATPQSPQGFPRTISRTNPETGKTESATVSSQAELDEAAGEGFK